jgi:hypothetical protein
MTEELCGTNPDKWKEMETEVIKSLVQRKQLWDGILQEIKMRKQTH